VSAKFDNNLRGALFKALKDKDNSPDYEGACEIAGVEYWISAWINTAKTTQRKFMSLKFKVKEPRAPKVPAPEAPFDDEIPF
jgi:hypothetical protein